MMASFGKKRSGSSRGLVDESTMIPKTKSSRVAKVPDLTTIKRRTAGQIGGQGVKASRAGVKSRSYIGK